MTESETKLKKMYFDAGFKAGEERAYKDLSELLQNPLTRKLIFGMATKEIKKEDLQKEIDKATKELS